MTLATFIASRFLAMPPPNADRDTGWVAAGSAPGEGQLVLPRRRRRGVLPQDHAGVQLLQVEGRQCCCCSLQAGGAPLWHWGGGELGALPLEVDVDGVAHHGESQQRQERVGEAQQRPGDANTGKQ